MKKLSLILLISFISLNLCYATGGLGKSHFYKHRGIEKTWTFNNTKGNRSLDVTHSWTGAKGKPRSVTVQKTIIKN